MEFILIAGIVSIVAFMISGFILRWIFDISLIIKNQEESNKLMKESIRLSEESLLVLKKIRNDQIKNN